jgi:hypothetical protein
MEHIRRYRINLQHESFRDEAMGLLLDCHVPMDEVQAAVESLWRLRRDDYCSMFRRRQRESRVRQIQHVSSLQAAGSMPADAPPRQLHDKHTSTMATKTLTFRTLRLKRIEFDVPRLMFGPETVSLAEICIHHRLLKLRQVQDNISGYRPAASDDGECADSSPMARVLATALRVDPFTPHERVLRASMLDVARRHKVPATYLHALLSIDSTTQWFLLYLIRQLQKGGSLAAQGGHLPEVMQGHWDHAVHIVGKWGAAGLTPKQPSAANRRPSTADPRRRATVPAVLSIMRPTSAKADQPRPTALGGIPRVSVRRVSPSRSSPPPALRIMSDDSPADFVNDAHTNVISPLQPPEHGASVLSPRGAQWARAVSPYSRSPLENTDTPRLCGVDAGSSPGADSFWTEALAHHNDSVARARVQMKQRAASLSARVSPRGLGAVSPPSPRQQATPRAPWQPPVAKALYRLVPTHTKPPAPPTLETILTLRRLVLRNDQCAPPVAPTCLKRPLSAPVSRVRRL